MFSIKPEQMGVFNAILILLLIPAFDRIVSLRLHVWGFTCAFG